VRRRVIVAAAMKAAMAGAVAALASGTPVAAQSSNQVAVAGGPISGAATVNAASGNFNAQANIGLISSGDAARSSGALVQHNGHVPANSGADSAAIAPGAFAGSTGWVAVNGAAGNDNQQANVAAFAFGTEAGGIADAVLSQSRASTQPTGGPAAPATDSGRTVGIADGAFGNSQGLVQVSLIGGDRNSSSNSFALSAGGPGTQ
jgi:hypothetical protein